MEVAQPPDPKPEAIEEDTIAWTSFAAQAKAVLSANEYLLLANIALAIGRDGMTPEEACMLVNLAYDDFKALAAKHPIIEKIVALKELEYKRGLLKAISKKARAGDDKLATYLLETRYPGEFGKKRATDASRDMLQEAISFIQKSGDSTPVVRSGVVPGHSPLVTAPAVVAGKKAAKELAGFLV